MEEIEILNTAIHVCKQYSSLLDLGLRCLAILFCVKWEKTLVRKEKLWLEKKIKLKELKKKRCWWYERETYAYRI